MNSPGRFTSACSVIRTGISVLLAAACAIDDPTGPRSPVGSGQATDAVAATELVACPDCIFGVETFVRATGTPNETTIEFAALPSADYVAELDDVDHARTIGEVTLNRQVLVSINRSPNDKATSREIAVTLATSNALTVRLVGRPGSGLRVAIRALRPVMLDAVTLAPATPVELDGPGVPFEFTAGNYTKAPRQNIGVQVWVTQGGAVRAAGGHPVACGGAPGELPPGRCTGPTGVSPSNGSVGSGTLVPGSASARIDVVEAAAGGNAVLDSRVVPIMLLAPPTPSVVDVVVVPPPAVQRFGPFLFAGVGATMQLTANVQVTGNASQSVTWNSSNPQIATVNSTGRVTAVSPGDVTIRATSTWDPTKSGSALVHVFVLAMRSPANGTNVSTGATTPPSNPLSVLLKAEACGPTGMFPNPFARLDFVVLRPGHPIIVVGSVAPGSAAVTDNGAERCWSYAVPWTPGAGLGTGVLPMAAIGHLADGTFAGGTPAGFSITMTDP